MKKTTLSLIIIFASYFGRGQCTLSINKSMTTVCYGESVLLIAAGAQSYSWSVNGTMFQYGDESSANFPSEVPNTGAGNYTITITGCNQTKTVILNYAACNYLIGHGVDNITPVYYDLNGQIVQPTKNTVLIKQVERIRKKIVFIETF